MACGDVESCPGPGSCFDRLSNVRGMHIYHQNIRGLLCNFEKVQSFFEMFKNIDILTLSETHISSYTHNDINELYRIPGFAFIKRNRTNRNHGGVAMYISNQIKWRRREDLECEEVEGLVIEVLLNGAKKFLVGSLYRPPDGSEYLDKCFNKLFEEMLVKISDLSFEVIILWDLNVNHLISSKEKELKDMIRLEGFEPLVKSPTRVTQDSSTLIDVILTKNEQAIASTDVAPLNMSDHVLIGCVRKVNHQKYKYRAITCCNYSNYDPEVINDELRSQNHNDIYKITDMSAQPGNS